MKYPLVKLWLMPNYACMNFPTISITTKCTKSQKNVFKVKKEIMFYVLKQLNIEVTEIRLPNADEWGNAC
jgi:hypothetical protein